MAGTVRVHVVAGPEFTRVAIALRAIDQALPRQLRGEMRDAVKPSVAEAKEKVRTMPVAGHSGTTGLRREVARGVKIQAGLSGRRGAHLRVVTAMTRPDAEIIPRGLDRAAGWRHPVFGNRDNWVVQRPQRPGWFLETLSDARDPIEMALTHVLEKARDRVASAGGGPI